jgi:asparagine synthase (glutamine-hydrolysing)
MGVDRTLEAVNGMFAFGAWDREERTLVLARDRVGEKPLLYGVIGGSFAFASELRALATLPGAPTELDPDAVALLLRFKYIPAPHTIHRGSTSSCPATCSRSGPVRPTSGEPRPYWSLADVAEAGARRPSDRPGGRARRARRLLATAVREPAPQRRADRRLPLRWHRLVHRVDPRRRAARPPLRTFTIASDDPDHDESAAAREVATRLGADHTELLVTASRCARSRCPPSPGSTTSPSPTPRSCRPPGVAAWPGAT